MPLAPQVTNTPEDITYSSFDITNTTKTSTTATYTAPGHTFTTGDSVVVSGIAPDGYNGTFTITSVVSGTSFTCANTTNKTITTATGNAFMADADFEFYDDDVVYNTNNEDVTDIIENDETVSAAYAAAIQAQTDAATAIANASAAYDQANTATFNAGVAQSTADGKNKVHYSTSGPSGSGTNGDIWFVLNGSQNVTAQYTYQSGSWVQNQITSTVIANLDAGKITAGTITSIAMNNGSGTFSVDAAGNLVASSATITGTIYASAGTFTGTVTATSGSFTGSIYSTSGTIGGWTITSSQIYSGTGAFMNATTGNIGGNSITAFSSILSYGSITTTSGGSIEAAGYIRANGNLYAANLNTTTSTANCFINSSSGLIARSTSSQRYKVAIEEQEIPVDSILALNPKSYVDKAEAEEKGTTDGLQRLLGLIAEDVIEIPVLGPMLANINEKGQPDSVNYDRVAVALIPLLKNLDNRVKALEGN